MPLAFGVVGVIVIVVVVLPLAALVDELLGRGNPRQDEMDAEREQVAEEIGLREPIDFESDLRPPREPSASMPGSANGDRATRWHRPASRRYGLAGRHRLVALEAVRPQRLQIGRHHVAASSTTSTGTSVVTSRVAGLPSRRAFGPTSD